jgi:hypothetical protein
MRGVMQNKEIIRDVVRECESCFDRHDVTGYARITEMLSRIEDPDESVVKALRLADGGPTLSSPRFAYPHIKSILTEN